MSFLPKYLAAAIIGTAAVYVGAPYLAQALGDAEQTPDPESQISQEPSNHADNSTTDGVGAVATKDAPSPNRLTSKPHKTGGGGAGATTSTLPRDVPIARGAPSTTSTPTPAAQQAEEPEVIVENVRGYTPSTETIRPSGNDVIYWGVAIVDTPLYDRDGKIRDEKLLGGTLIEQTDAKSSSKGEMAICRIWRKNGWAGSYLVSTADLIRFDGGREEVDAADVANLCRYYGLSAAIERRKEELTQKAASSNPFFSELKRKATTYNANVKRAEELTAKRDQAKGAERTKIIAELTKLKNSEAREAAEVKELTRKYEEWKKSHPATSQSPSGSDPVIRGYERQMQELRGKLEVFGI